MSTTNIIIPLDTDLKNELDYIFSKSGLTTTEAFTLFAEAIVREKRIPFELTLRVPNQETLEAIQDARLKKNLSKNFTNVENLMDDLDN